MTPDTIRKNALSDLALFGGVPLFEQTLHVGRPNIGDRERFQARLDNMFDRRWLSNNGPFVQEFEDRLAKFLGVKHCIAMCNATVALEIAGRALELKGEVILPSFTFVATAHSLQWQGITPVFCDVDPSTHNLAPARVEELITSRTSGIMGVHVWCRPCAVEELTAIAARHDLKLMYDAAHAFGCSYRGAMIGGFGSLEVFSFHATKFFNTFEGGAVATNDDDLAERIRFMTNFGFKDYDTVAYLGTNGKMSEVSAAMGLTGLESLQEFIDRNHAHYHTYQTRLQDIPGLRLIRFTESEKNNYQYVVLEIDEETAHISRDLLNDLLHAENVLSRRYFHPGCHQMEPYRTLFPEVGRRLPETEKLTRRVLQLPTGTALEEQDVIRLCDLIRFIIAHAPEIHQRVQASD